MKNSHEKNKIKSSHQYGEQNLRWLHFWDWFVQLFWIPEKGLKPITISKALKRDQIFCTNWNSKMKDETFLKKNYLN
jgi:hypothetical protein